MARVSRRRGKVPLAVSGADSGQPRPTSSSTSAVVSSTLYCGAGMPPLAVGAGAGAGAGVPAARAAAAFIDLAVARDWAARA